jgi:hypothetical protein
MNSKCRGNNTLGRENTIKSPRRWEFGPGGDLIGRLGRFGFVASGK